MMPTIDQLHAYLVNGVMFRLMDATLHEPLLATLAPRTLSVTLGTRDHCVIYSFMDPDPAFKPGHCMWSFIQEIAALQSTSPANVLQDCLHPPQPMTGDLQ